jgi:hypothetical protein
MNRAAGVFWERVRTKLDAWYAGFPDETEDLRRRFRSDLAQQHFAAWWELYLYTVLRALGYEVTPHPQVPETTSRPDFLAERGAESFYVEAKTSFSGIASQERQPALAPAIQDIIESIDSPNFWLTLQWERVAGQMPRRRTIVAPIEAWLDTLDPDDDPGSERWERFEFGDCAISLSATPWKRGFEARAGNPVIGMQLGFGGYVNHVEMTRDSVRRKGRRYSPDKPLIVAVLAMSGFLSDRDVANALFGREAVQIDVATGETKLVRDREGVWIG